MTRVRLQGGHSDGRVVDIDDPAPPYLQVPYRVPADPFDVPLDPLDISLDIDTYELMITPIPYGPPVREYVCRHANPAS